MSFQIWKQKIKLSEAKTNKAA